MKTFLTSLCFAILVACASAQTTLPNSGFETWVSSGSPPPFDWEQPGDWSSTNPVTEFISAGITKSTDEHGGTFAVQIKTLNVFGTHRAGGLVCGDAQTQTSPNYTILPITGGEPVSDKPTTVRGYYKFSTVTAGDSAYVIAINKKWNASLNEADTVGFGIIKLPPASDYTLFELDIADWNVSLNPDSIVVAFFSSNPDTALEGGILLVDDVELDFATNVTTASGDIGFNVYPNPASNFLNLSLDQNNFVQMNVYSSVGKKIYSQNISQANTLHLDVRQFSQGLYWIEMKTNSGEILRGEFLKVD